MLLIKIIGIVIILLNVAGLGFILYLSGVMLKNRFSPKKQLVAVRQKKIKPVIANDNIITDDDDLLKDMDLSDLDNLNLDDFD